MNRIRVACLVAPLFPIVATMAGPPEEREGTSRQAHGPGERARQASVIRVARSDDGLSFSGSGKVFLHHAAAPDLIQLPNGHLIAVFDYLRGTSGGQTLVMGVSRSTDSGKSWSRPMPLHLSSKRSGRFAAGTVSWSRSPRGGFDLLHDRFRARARPQGETVPRCRRHSFGRDTRRHTVPVGRFCSRSADGYGRRTFDGRSDRGTSSPFRDGDVRCPVEHPG